jgi:hypothetical protein
MGKVYRADDLTLGQSVARKFLPAELAWDPERLARFHAEGHPMVGEWPLRDPTERVDRRGSLSSHY